MSYGSLEDDAPRETDAPPHHGGHTWRGLALALLLGVCAGAGAMGTFGSTAQGPGTKLTTYGGAADSNGCNGPTVWCAKAGKCILRFNTKCEGPYSGRTELTAEPSPKPQMNSNVPEHQNFMPGVNGW